MMTTVLINNQEFPLVTFNQVHEHDIWCKRGSAAKKYPGNIFYTKLVDEWKDEYAKKKKTEDKREIAQKIFVRLNERQPPGRFFREMDNGDPDFLNDEECLEKIKQALRDKKKVTNIEQIADDLEPFLPDAQFGIKNSRIILQLESSQNILEEINQSPSNSHTMDVDVVSNNSRLLGGSLKEISTNSGMQQPSRERLCQSLPCHSGVNGLDRPFDTEFVPLMNRSTSSTSHRNLFASSVSNDYDKNNESPRERGSIYLPREAELGRSPMEYQTLSDQTMGTFDVSSTRTLLGGSSGNVMEVFETRVEFLMS